MIDVNSNDLISEINYLNADLIVYINCPLILNEKTINQINAPIFNFHPGDLPTFRGRINSILFIEIQSGECVFNIS